MYNEYFGLEHTPFRLTPDPRLFYPGGGRGEVLDALIYAITSGEGIIKVVGEVGTGKTMLCRMLEERLPEEVEIVYLANPSLTPEDILHAIALELGIEAGPSASRIQIMHSVQQVLLERHARNRRVVALVEEAQSMPRDTLEEIRLLSNLETKSEKLLQIVLFGQPELDENLAVPEIRQLRERITHGFTLKALNTDEIRQYMEFRLRSSGYRGREAFSSKAYKAMAKASEGLTRRVNILADKSLLAAFAEDTHDVSERHVKVAIEDTQLSLPQHRKSAASPLLMAAGFVLAAAIGWVAAAWYVGNERVPGPERSVARVEAEQQATPAVADPAPLPAAGDKVENPQSGNPPATNLPLTAASAEKAVESATGPATGTSADPEPQEQQSATPPPAPVPAAGPVSSARLAADSTSSLPVPEQTPEPGPTTAAPPDAGTAGAAVVSLTPPAAPVVEPARQQPLAAGPQPSPAPSGLSSPVLEQPPAQAVVAVSGQPLSPQDAGRNAQTGQPSPQVAADAGSRVAKDLTLAAAPPQTAAAPRPGPKPAAAPSGTRNILEERLDRTRVWLRQVNPRHYSIQVLATAASRRLNLKNFLARRVRSGHIQDLYVYETTIDRRPWYGVLYGEFTEFSKARQALRDLPESMTRHQPFIRNISDITAKL